MIITLKNKRGVTLVELIVAVFIFSLIYLAVTAFQKNVWTFSMNINDTLLGQQEAKQSLKTMIKEIRIASAGGDGSYAISETGTSSMTFYSDIDGNGSKEKVRYYLATTTLKKQVTKASGNPLTYPVANAITTELAHSVINSSTTPIFYYYASTYAGTTSSLTSPFDVTAVRLVKVTLTIEKDPRNNPAPMTISSQVEMRNLKDNL